VALYFDKLQILRSDYEQTLKEAGSSSYHHAVAVHLDALIEEACPQIEIVDELAGLPASEEIWYQADALLNYILSSANDASDPLLSPMDPVNITADAYQDWINYNKRKATFLRDDEPYRNELLIDLIPGWENRRAFLIELESSPESEVIDRFMSDMQAVTTLKYLLASALRCINLVDHGQHIHDPMLVEYRPVIDLVERIRSDPGSVAHGKSRDFMALLEAYHFRMSRYGEVVPLKFGIRDVPRIVEVYTPIRSALEKVDSTLETISEDDPARAFDVAKKEIAPLVKLAKTAARSVEYGFWAVGLATALVAVVGSPFVTGRLKDALGTIALAERNVGRFAGAYAMVADEMVIGQRRYLKAHNVPRSYEGLRQTYWDPV
jgi:hypothetical protein